MSILKWICRFGHIGFVANQYIQNQYVNFYSYKMDISGWTYRLAGGIGRLLYPDHYVHLPFFQSFYSLPSSGPCLNFEIKFFFFKFNLIFKNFQIFYSLQM
jgi:hypothetical protein